MNSNSKTQSSLRKASSAPLPVTVGDNGGIGATLDIGSFTHAGNLLDRETGERIGAAIWEELRQLPPGGLLAINCGGIRNATYSALSATLMTSGVISCLDRYLLLQIHSNQSEFCEAIVDLAHKHSAAFPAIDEAGDWRVFGKLTFAETQTLEIVRSQGGEQGITAALLAAQMEILTSAASNRLKHLFDRRLIRREERLRPVGGREFVYWPLL